MKAPGAFLHRGLFCFTTLRLCFTASRSALHGKNEYGAKVQ